MKNNIYLTKGGELLKEVIADGKSYLQNYNLEGIEKEKFNQQELLLLGNLNDEKIRKFYKKYDQIDIYMKARIDELIKIKQQMDYKKEDWQKLEFIKTHVKCGIETINETLGYLDNY